MLFYFVILALYKDHHNWRWYSLETHIHSSFPLLIHLKVRKQKVQCLTLIVGLYIPLAVMASAVVRQHHSDKPHAELQETIILQPGVIITKI